MSPEPLKAPEFLYRFRSIEKLLGEDFQELDRQTIYFAKPNELNDPMEGFRDVIWNGDDVAWRNLFKHYLMCLFKVTILAQIESIPFELTQESIPVSESTDSFIAPEIARSFATIKRKFFGPPLIENLLTKITERTTPIRKDELCLYLQSIHPFAFNTILDNLPGRGLLRQKAISETDDLDGLSTLLDSDFFELLQPYTNPRKGSNKSPIHLFDLVARITSQIRLQELNKKGSSSILETHRFPSAYIQRLEELVFPNWYTACFMTNCKNSSVWGHYGDRHAGACLIFKPKLVKNAAFLTLDTVCGFGPTGEYSKPIKHQLHRINYISGSDEIDFFRSLGTLPAPVIQRTWHMSEEGKRSRCTDAFVKDEQAWREQYWANFHRDILKKTKDWEYEDEYRLILTENLVDFTPLEKRVLTYDFQSLSGIIFGINTPEIEKLKIFNIVEKKCQKEKRSDFKFYQAYYSPETQCIERYDLHLLNHQLSKAK